MVVRLEDHQATVETISELLNQASQQYWDQVVVYFSGHGSEEGLVAWDGVFPFAALAHAIRAIPANWRLLVLDACFAGAVHDFFDVGGLGKLAAPDVTRLYLDLLREAAPGLRVMTAVDRSALALEFGEQGAFTTALLKAALAASPDLSSYGVSAARIFAIARQHLPKLGAPTPQASGKLKDLPLALSDKVHPLGNVEPVAEGVEWTPFVPGEARAFDFSFSVGIQGRKFVPTLFRHALVGVTRTYHLEDARVVPTSNQEEWDISFQVPWHLLPAGREVRSILTVQDGTGRILGRVVSPFRVPIPRLIVPGLRHAALNIPVLRLPR